MRKMNVTQTSVGPHFPEFIHTE